MGALERFGTRVTKGSTHSGKPCPLCRAPLEPGQFITRQPGNVGDMAHWDCIHLKAEYAELLRGAFAGAGRDREAEQQYMSDVTMTMPSDEPLTSLDIDEFFDVYRQFRPDDSREEYEKAWEEFQSFKTARAERRKLV